MDGSRRVPRASIEGGDAFRLAAARYCELIDARTRYHVDDFLSRVADALLDLSREAQRLPDIDARRGDESRPSMTTEEWMALFRSLGDYLGVRDAYWGVFEPTCPGEREACAMSLADDLADIYRDLRDGLAAWDSGRPDEAAWGWRFTYWSHWGAHAVGALGALHWHQRSLML
jgi:hypothetical protein